MCRVQRDAAQLPARLRRRSLLRIGSLFGVSYSYAGPANVTLEGRVIAVHCVLSKRVDPRSGLHDWAGTATPTASADSLLDGLGQAVMLRIGEREGEVIISNVDAGSEAAQLLGSGAAPL